jgi:hypothetical protein
MGFKSELIVNENNMNADRHWTMFIENGILDGMREHFGESPGSFQRHGAPAHRAKTGMTFLQKEINKVPD